MTDRELLELAAKAAGISLDRLHAKYDNWDKEYAPVLVRRAWNPLEDDGDALRVAVKLEMDVLQRRSEPEVWVQAPMMPTVCVSMGDDRQAATRRAIVRAAAEIGRANDD